MGLLDQLSDQQREAVQTIDDDLEIIACAGAGKTGVVTRRIINILKSKSEILPENIVAFTFTRKAAEELKGRIYDLGKRELGDTIGFAHMYIGTIHGFCIKMLQEYIPEFQKYDVLDEIHTKLFVECYYDECGMKDLDLCKYKETNLFVSVMSILNENWFEQDKWDERTRTAYKKYKEKLYAEKKFDYSLILQEMICQLENNIEFAQIIADKVKYLTVDEYQDINPIQERLIRRLKELGANLCVVGDDDQTIYQFRGSDAQNILTFKERYGVQKYIVLDKNYRSTDGIVDVAKRVIVHNDHRLSKTMKSGCQTPYDIGDVAFEEREDTDLEYEFIAHRMEKLHEIGIPYSEMAVLVRKKKISGQIAAKLEEYHIPYIVEGMNELFDTKECQAAKGIYDYLNGDITFVWKVTGHTDNQDDITKNHEYILCYAKNKFFTKINSIVDPNIGEESKVNRNFAENSITKNGYKNPPSIIELPIGFPCEAECLHRDKMEAFDSFYKEATENKYISREMSKKYKAVYPIPIDDMDVEDYKLTHPCRVSGEDVEYIVAK